MPEVPLALRDVLDADDALVRLELGHAVDEQERIPVGQDPFDGGVIERQFRVMNTKPDAKYNSNVLPASRSMSHHPTPPPTPPRSTSANEQDILLTLFDLGRQVASVIDFDELLQRIPELIRRLIQFDAFAVYLLDEKRGELASRTRSATRTCRTSA